MRKECARCGKEFEAYGASKYCSEECRTTTLREQRAANFKRFIEKQRNNPSERGSDGKTVPDARAAKKPFVCSAKICRGCAHYRWLGGFMICFFSLDERRSAIIEGRGNIGCALKKPKTRKKE